MLLSLIVPVYLRSKSLKKFLRKMINQTSNDYEIIFAIDTNLENVLSLIESYEKQLKGKVKYIFNNRRCGRNQAIETALEEASSEYSILISYSDVIYNTFIEDSLKLLKNKNADIIEFNPSINEPIHYRGFARKKFIKVTEIAKKPEIICYAYPFDFNKFFKTSLLRKVFAKPLKTSVNSRFAIDTVYKALLFAKNYVYVQKTLLYSRSELSRNFNPLKIIRQWTSLQEFAVQNGFYKFLKEIEYSKFFHEIVFMFGFVYASKNKKMMDKLSTIFQKQLKNEFQLFLSTNPYILLKNHEAPLIKENLARNKMVKLYKIIEHETKK